METKLKILNCPKCEKKQVFEIIRVWKFGRIKCKVCGWNYWEMWSFIERVGR